MDELRQNKCDRVRDFLSEVLESKDLQSDSVEFDGEPLSVHLTDCSPCRQWQEQTGSIVDMARSLPQFDVPERLTQSILAGVALEESAKQRQLSWIVYAVAVASFLYLVLFVDAYESVWGIASWVLGLATMWGLKLLISEPVREKQVT